MWGVEFGVGSCHLAKRSVRRNLVLPEVNEDKSVRNTSAAVLHATRVVTWRLRTDHSSQRIAGLTLHPDGLKTYNVPGLLTTALDFEFLCPPIRQAGCARAYSGFPAGYLQTHVPKPEPQQVVCPRWHFQGMKLQRVRVSGPYHWLDEPPDPRHFTITCWHGPDVKSRDSFFHTP